MAEYIDREKAIEVMEKSLTFCENELDIGEYRKGCIAAIQDDIGNVKHIPTADVVEAKHGEWIDRYNNKYDNHLYICSVCGGEALYEFYANELGQTKSRQALTVGCPHCLAKMDKRSEDK